MPLFSINTAIGIILQHRASLGRLAPNPLLPPGATGPAKHLGFAPGKRFLTQKAITRTGRGPFRAIKASGTCQTNTNQTGLTG